MANESDAKDNNEPQVLLIAQLRAFLVSGESKHTAVAEWRAGKDIPARAIVPAAGVDVLVASALLVLVPYP